MAKTVLQVGDYFLNLEHVTHIKKVADCYDVFIGTMHLARVDKKANTNSYVAVEEWLKLRTIKTRSATQLPITKNFEEFGLEDLDILDVSDDD